MVWIVMLATAWTAQQIVSLLLARPPARRTQNPLVPLVALHMIHQARSMLNHLMRLTGQQQFSHIGSLAAFSF